MKQVLFVINTLGCAGAETAMIEMIRNMDPEKYKISVFVLLNQGEMIHRLPKSVTVLNEHFSDSSVLSKEGKKELNRCRRPGLVERRGGCRREGRRRADGGGVDRVEAR